MEINSYFGEDLLRFVRDGVADNSESAICKNIIAPIFKEIWKSYNKIFLLWSHESFRYNERLSEPRLYFGKAITPGKNYFKVALFTSSRSKAK